MSTAIESANQNADRYVPVQRGHGQQKRSRIQLSCTSCRHAKLRCDRSQPCNQCLKRNRATLCAYATVSERHRPPRDVRGRLHHLESLIIGMMNEKPLSPEPSNSSLVPLSQSGTSGGEKIQGVTNEESNRNLRQGQVEANSAWISSGEENVSSRATLGMNGKPYVGATHWAAILEDIEGVKAFLDEIPDEDPDPVAASQTAALGLGNSQPMNRADLLAALPERSVVDRLVSRYFNSNDPTMIIIHKPTFQKEQLSNGQDSLKISILLLGSAMLFSLQYFYCLHITKYQEFWSDPSSKPLMWIGLLYAILCLATFYFVRAGDALPDEALKSTDKYRTLCAQSLTLANYFKPGIYTIEALSLLFASELGQPGDSAGKCWVLHAMAVRLALRMGYHRDARHHSNISPFHGEMRRRVWHLLVQVDLILSFQVGLPSMIKAIQSDTAPPSNLFDHDFSQESSQLPHARPEFELTPLSYMICKARICHAFGKIVDQANSIEIPAYSEILEMDAHLHAMYSLIPSFLMIRPLEQSITDSPSLIMQRFNIVLLYHKCRCVLHRKYLTKKDSWAQYGYSQSSCIESALELLHYQSVINDAVQCGGPLSMDKWYLSTIAAHDFLLGAMVIYLNLINHSQGNSLSYQAENKLGSEIDKKAMMLQKLEISYNIWKSSPREARDARKASAVLNIMLKNLKEHPSRDYYGGLTCPDQLDTTTGELQFPQNEVGNLHDGQINKDGPDPPGQIEDIGNMINLPDLLDWDAWDSHINAPAHYADQIGMPSTNSDDFGFTDILGPSCQ